MIKGLKTRTALITAHVNLETVFCYARLYSFGDNNNKKNNCTVHSVLNNVHCS